VTVWTRLSGISTMIPFFGDGDSSTMDSVKRTANRITKRIWL
jgi:hypothetical protein